MNPLEAVDTLRTKLAHNTRDYRPEDHALDVLVKFFNAIGTEPAVVLVNMMRGFIAKPSPLAFANLYGPVIGDIERANLEIAELRARLTEVLGPMNTSLEAAHVEISRLRSELAVEPVATVCLTTDQYAHNHCMEVQLQVDPGTQLPIGTKLYIAPPGAK